MKIGLTLLVALLAACSGAPAPSASVGPSPTPSPSPTAPPDARIIGNAGLFLGNESFSVAAATSDEAFAALWASLDQQAAAPEVDFGQEIVIFLGISGSSSCPERFGRLVVDEQASHVYAQWAEHPRNQACTDDLQAQGVLLAVARSALPAGQFRLTLREQLICADCPDHPDQVVVDRNT
jgi:hypothetical protein